MSLLTLARSARLLMTSMLLLGLTTLASAADVPKRIDRFALPDMYGRERALSDFDDAKLVVIAFVGTECPLSRLYAPRLQELADKYAGKVAFVGIDSNEQDSLTELNAYARQYGVKFPLLKDREQSVADQFGVVRNPAVYVLDADRKIRYAGRIDDQYGQGSSSGYAKDKVKDSWLTEALDELLAGKEVSKPSIDASGCIIGRKAKVAPTGDISYTKHIASILESRCVQCHRAGQIGPFALQDYSEVVGWAAMIKEVVGDGRMPPWSASPEYGHFLNDARLTATEKTQLFAWIDNGCPQGDLADLPKRRDWTDGWRIPQPVQVVKMAKPFRVPAEGVVDYKNFTVDPGWKEDKWIKAAEALPGNRAVVHHIIVSAIPPGVSADEVDDVAEGAEIGVISTARGRGGRNSEAGRIGLGGYVPGGTVVPQRPGVAQFIPAGSKVHFQMHYTPNGVEQDDQSMIGIVFADPAEVKKIVHGGNAMNTRFAIPPGADAHKVESEHTFASDQLLFRMMPHMHLRGKAFRYEAVYPDGTREILLDVPKYDFNWQITYHLEEPKLMPKGTKLHCTAYFDNSDNNMANPNPAETVRWGPQTWQEMMIGWFGTLSVDDDAQQKMRASAK